MHDVNAIVVGLSFPVVGMYLNVGVYSSYNRVFISSLCVGLWAVLRLPTANTVLQYMNLCQREL